MTEVCRYIHITDKYVMPAQPSVLHCPRSTKHTKTNHKNIHLLSKKQYAKTPVHIVCVCLQLSTTVALSTAQNGSDNVPSFLQSLQSRRHLLEVTNLACLRINLKSLKQIRRLDHGPRQ